ncbi:MAG: bifunctional nicotinamidase/pyrazinamidase [Gemmatimonadota bacterium]|nr:MAG: bifunctional nicotinamidase/pyrazinamidase [Gemmatimonadota bacterium]
MRLEKALLVVSVQNDFCSGGALTVPWGDDVVPVLNAYIELFSERRLPVFASRNWHPKRSKHFREFGGQWPIHCVQNTDGARFHGALTLPQDVIVLSKGMDPEKDTYSDFESFDSNGVAFSDILRILGIDELFVGGLATDSCVKHTVLDALKFGFQVKLLMDGIRGVNVKSKDSEAAIREMMKHGAKKMTLGRLPASVPERKRATCDHIGIFTMNVKKLSDFYVRTLGFKSEKEEVFTTSLMRKALGVHSDCMMIRLVSGDVRLELFQPTSVRLARRLNISAGYNHWGYHVGDRGRYVRKLKKKGVPIIEVRRNDRTVYFVKDPDGNRIEIRGY